MLLDPREAIRIFKKNNSKKKKEKKNSKRLNFMMC